MLILRQQMVLIRIFNSKFIRRHELRSSIRTYFLFIRGQNRRLTPTRRFLRLYGLTVAIIVIVVCVIIIISLAVALGRKKDTVQSPPIQTPENNSKNLFFFYIFE
jgi:hypothetical protein